MLAFSEHARPVMLPVVALITACNENVSAWLCVESVQVVCPVAIAHVSDDAVEPFLNRFSVTLCADPPTATATRQNIFESVTAVGVNWAASASLVSWPCGAK
jgi:hypothetical protein